MALFYSILWLNKDEEELKNHRNGHLQIETFHVKNYRNEQTENSISYIINPRPLLPMKNEEESDDSLLLLSMVIISPQNFERRMMIRYTWANSSEFLRTVFFCGRSADERVNKILEFENFVFDDIVQADFHDSYYNLTLKSILAFKWAGTVYSPRNLKFVVKIDDDVVPNVLGLIQYLKRLAVQKKYH